MADFFTGYSNAVPKQTSLSDMVDMASGIQKYQQAQQLNPIQLERAKSELQTSQQTAGKGKIELSLSQQANQERLNIQNAVAKNPQIFQTNGRFDPNKLMEQLPILAPMTHTDYIDKYNKALETTSKAEGSVLKLSQDRKQDIGQMMSSLGYAGVTDPNVVIKQLDNLANINKKDTSYVDSINSFKDVIKQHKEGPAVTQSLLTIGASLMSPSEQQTAFAPEAGTQDVGGTIKEIIKKKSVLGSAPSIQQTGRTFNKSLAPQVYTTETGAPGIIGGGGGGNVNAPVQQNVPRNVGGNVGGNVQGGQPIIQSNLQTAFSAKGGLQRAPDETYEAYRARTARLGGLPTASNNALNMANVESIPNQEYTNNKIIKLLENKNVDVGPIAKSIADKTGGIGLSSEQQEVMKYLEQRIRQESARSNQDQTSQRSAFGSFGTDKNALLDIIYNDKGNLASQRLYHQGVLKYQGNPNKPNLGAINEFENRFNQINRDPDVTHLLGIVGDKSMENLSKSDVQQLKKYYGNMPKDKLDELFAKKQELEDLVRGAK
jgi:hypothetical protein